MSTSIDNIRKSRGKPKIIPEQAEVVRRIYGSFLSGHSLRMIKDMLEREGIPTVNGGSEWSASVVRGILQNEKYCGDVLQQKTFVNDCISRKHIRNVGQLPMYLTQNHYEGIVSRDIFNAVKAEFARRSAGRALSQKMAPTGRSCYSAKYALTERLVCGECGTLYRRCVWSKRGQKRLCGAAPVGWTTVQNTATTPLPWMRHPYRPPSSLPSTQP